MNFLERIVMDKNISPQQGTKIDFYFWLLHETLSIEDVCLLFSGLEPNIMNKFKFKFFSTFNISPLQSIICDGVRSNQLKIDSNNCVSPIACYYYLSNKGFLLPEDLVKVLDNDLQEINEKLKTKVKKRGKESYQRKDVRGDDKALDAVLRTLLDLLPDLPKDSLIRLKPVQEYANGKKHSEQSLKNMISKIEGANRKSGNVSNKNKEILNREVPKSWVNFELEED